MRGVGGCVNLSRFRVLCPTASVANCPPPHTLDQLKKPQWSESDCFVATFASLSLWKICSQLLSDREGAEEIYFASRSPHPQTTSLSDWVSRWQNTSNFLWPLRPSLSPFSVISGVHHSTHPTYTTVKLSIAGCWGKKPRGTKNRLNSSLPQQMVTRPSQ